MKPKPIIGITADRVRAETGFLYQGLIEKYIDAIVNAGGMPFVIPITVPETGFDTILSRLDGILFSGGGDVDPEFYGGTNHPEIRKVFVDRDRVELKLVKDAVRDMKPFLGICRGIQVINVALGGSLYADIMSQHPGAIKHDYYPGWPRDHRAHPVTLDKKARITGIMGVEHTMVNSLHHQAISQLAPGLDAVGHAPDGIIEAVELIDHPFGMAIQWHPEWMTDVNEMALIFVHFVRAASDQT